MIGGCGYPAVLEDVHPGHLFHTPFLRFTGQGFGVRVSTLTPRPQGQGLGSRGLNLGSSFFLNAKPCVSNPKP